MQRVGGGVNFTVLVDYAHNAASLEAQLLMLREYNYKSITTVFGCGGERARDRRFDMGEVSGRLSTFTVVTSDNPRGEAPGSIIEDILTGVRRTQGKYATIEDRREAIGYAIKNAAEGDLVLIAGKGHETTQTLADSTVPFDDVQVAGEFIKMYYNNMKSER
jgi:UDP-N-acetylmuramoyl-L-alanyl-D-glutamate--2,6-diaminopimelate ligase